ncbi:Nn.00g055700.m01.CDS01 [Neocucurbitaria sp. VM-36]
MKLSWGFIAASLYCSASAVRPTVSPETARLILAQRLGLSRFHSIEHADPETIRHINAYGGRQQKLFGVEDADRTRAHLLLWIEDAEQDEATVIISDGSAQPQDFAISHPPVASDNDRLIQDFISQAQSLPEYPDPKKHTYTSSIEIEATLPSDNKPELYNEYLSVFRASRSDKFSSEEIAKVLSEITNKAAELGFSTTTVIMPAPKPRSKRAANPWGTYDLPSKEARRENPEAVLSSNPEPSSSPNSQVSDLEDFPVITFAEEKAPVRGILPSCFDTLSACQRQTHNCSSHGECKLLHKGRGSGSKQESVDCYGCACVPTIVREDKGMETKKKVTYWGGPACQKKDISVQFWLFVGSGVVLSFLVASGIGMLYSMGSEELPSVIGAGVSGPVRK